MASCAGDPTSVAWSSRSIARCGWSENCNVSTASRMVGLISDAPYECWSRLRTAQDQRPVLAVPAPLRRRARGRCPAPRAKSRPCGFDPSRLRPFGPARSTCPRSSGVCEAALLFPSTYHAVLAVKGCALRRLRPCGRLRPLTAALRRVSPVPGNSARFGLEHDHVATFSFSRFFPTRS